MGRIIINTLQGHWSQIMYNSNGIEPYELIVITGEHNDMNRDFLLNMWGFSIPRILYISYDRNEKKLINDWWSSRLDPDMREINSFRFIDVKNKDQFNSLMVKKSINKYRPQIVCIENIEFDNNFEEIISQLKEITKSMHVSIIINVNPDFVDVDTVLNSESLNKIWYLTNKSIYVYKKDCDGIKIPIWHLPQYHIIGEDDSGDTEEVKRIRKEMTKEKHYACQTAQAQNSIQQEQEQEQSKEKEKKSDKKLQMSFN